MKYWIGTGGCVIVVALLISWTIRGKGGGSEEEGRGRGVAALAVGMVIALYLYAHTVKSFTCGLISIPFLRFIS